MLKTANKLKVFTVLTDKQHQLKKVLLVCINNMQFNLKIFSATIKKENFDFSSFVL